MVPNPYPVRSIPPTWSCPNGLESQDPIVLSTSDRNRKVLFLPLSLESLGKPTEVFKTSRIESTFSEGKEIPRNVSFLPILNLVFTKRNNGPFLKESLRIDLPWVLPKRRSKVFLKKILHAFLEENEKSFGMNTPWRVLESFQRVGSRSLSSF